MMLLKISASNLNSFSFYPHLKFQSIVALKLKEMHLAKKWHFQRSFLKKLLLLGVWNFVLWYSSRQISNFQNLSNPPYWILKMQKNVIFSGSVQNYCCYKGQTGKIQLGRSKVAPRIKKIIFCR